jgi:glycosyltransferase involved in cell wall biosynthesis
MNQPRNLRILLVSEPGWTGVFRHVEGLADFLHESGQQVAFAYSDVRGSEGLTELVKRIISRGGPVRNLRISHAPQWGDLRASALLQSLIREFQPDIIHAHSSKAGALTRIPGLFHLIKTPLFYTPNAYYGMARQGGLAEFIFTSIERLLANVGHTINISKDEATFARNILGLRPEHQFIIHNPVQIEFFKPASQEQKLQARKKLGIPEGSILLGTAGRLCFEKDPETLYQALQPVFRNNPKARLLHMISGDADPKLEFLAERLGIRKQIHLLPYQEDLRPAYHSLDGFLMTSRYEAGWPIVILEALACGLPLVSSTGPGMSDIGHGGLSHCWTASVGDVKGFTQSISALVADLTHGRPNNHRQIAETRFSPEHCYGAVLKAYRTTVPS